MGLDRLYASMTRSGMNSQPGAWGHQIWAGLDTSPRATADSWDGLVVPREGGRRMVQNESLGEEDVQMRDGPTREDKRALSCPSPQVTGPIA